MPYRIVVGLEWWKDEDTPSPDFIESHVSRPFDEFLLAKLLFTRLVETSEGKDYAAIRWSPQDVLDALEVTDDNAPSEPLATEEAAEAWLAANAKYIVNAMTERGWRAIDDLLADDPISNYEEE